VNVHDAARATHFFGSSPGQFLRDDEKHFEWRTNRKHLVHGEIHTVLGEIHRFTDEGFTLERCTGVESERNSEFSARRQAAFLRKHGFLQFELKFVVFAWNYRKGSKSISRRRHRGQWRRTQPRPKANYAIMPGVNPAGERSKQADARPDMHAVRAAHQRILPHIHRSPVFTCASLDEQAGARLFFKCENLQKTGSFKIRGATNAVFALDTEEAARGVVTHSSGNHAAALAFAARRRGIPAWIVMPSNAPRAKRAAVEAYGGRITECEPTLAARETTANAILASTGARLIHPYNNFHVIAGQATAALEFLEEVPELDVILAPVSGGGLLSGTAIAAKSLRPAIRVIGAEPRNADDAYRSLQSGQLEAAAKSETIADGLRATLCPLTFSILRERVDEISLVSEEEIIAAMRAVWERMKLLVEPSAAVAVAPALNRRIRAEGKRVGIILSGGNLDLAHLPFA
jgi:threonine dehydratase